MTIQTATYFDGIYSEIRDKISRVPRNDPSPNIQECLASSNFVRAERLAKEHNLDHDIITHIQELAVRQYMLDYKNEPGLQALTRAFRITQEELNRMIGLVRMPERRPSLLSRIITWIKGIFKKSK